MAGFLNRFQTTTFGSAISNMLLKISSFGMEFNDQVVKQSQAVGVTEANFADYAMNMSDEMKFSLAMADIGPKKYISFYDQDYKNKREFLRKFAMNGEVEWILDTICDEAIVYDERNFFAHFDASNLNSMNFKEEKKTELEEKINHRFKSIYDRFNFNDDITAWNYFKKFMIDGFLAFEIIYSESDKNKEIIAFKEIDPISLKFEVRNTAEGLRKFWIQYEDQAAKRRELSDAQVIYISYAQGNFMSRISYVERLVRSFNLLRLMENSRLIWSIMNSTYRMKTTVPIGNQPKQRAQESLNELLNQYKEDIYLDFDSGELLINGKASMQYYKNYMLPEKNGEKPDIETVSGEGPDLNDTESLKYFQRKLQVDSKVPQSRFDRENGGGGFQIGADGLDREEIRFYKFINRLRSLFQEVLIKPLYLQCLIDFPDLRNDEEFKTSLGVKFYKDNLFEQLKFMEITQKKLDFCNALGDYTEEDGSTPYFSKDFIIKKYSGFTMDDFKANEESKKTKSKKKDEGEEAVDDIFK